MNGEYPFGFTYGEKDGVRYKISLGCPDNGPPGNRHCYQCYEPVDDKTLNSYLEYNDPMAAVLGKCDICSAPDYYDVGHCPACNGPVYNFGDSYACYNTISGTCDFAISKKNTEKHEIYSNLDFGDLLIGPRYIRVNERSGERYRLYQRIEKSKRAGWVVKTSKCRLAND